ncbi:TPA: hypothetical protein EYM82_24910 [Candidatus Poribacteria bacterium]|nr:hypothetical protein [Candidatus Poribacteria bacterium]
MGSQCFRPVFLSNPIFSTTTLPTSLARRVRQTGSKTTYTRGASSKHERHNCGGRSWFHSTSWWGCMNTSPLSDEEWKTVIAYSHSHITMVDEAIGRVFDGLDFLNLTDSTTVVFVADHGDMEGAHNRFRKRRLFL